MAPDVPDGLAAPPADARVAGARGVTPVAVDPLTCPALFGDADALLDLLQRQRHPAGAREAQHFYEAGAGLAFPGRPSRGRSPKQPVEESHGVTAPCRSTPSRGK